MTDGRCPTDEATEALSRLRVLILDDNPFRALDIEDTVAQAYSADVFVTNDPHEARLLRPFDVAILGRFAKGICTFAFAREMKVEGTAVAYVSGGDPSTIPSDLCHYFIPAPCRPEHVNMVVRNMLSR